LSVLLEPVPTRATLSPYLRALHPDRRPELGLLVYCAFLFVYGLNSGALYRTEGLRAIVAAEMLRSGDWLVPRLYGEPLLTKPPGHYAAIALVSWPCGEVREWTARLPSALAATFIVFLIYRWFSHVFDRRVGFVAALLAPISLMWLDRVPSAEIDMVQVAWIVASLYGLFRAVEAAENDASLRRQQLWWLIALLCVAGGVLTKWTAPAFFYLTAIPFLWWRGRLQLLVSRSHLVAVLVAAGLCSLWIATVVSRVSWNLFFETLRQEALPKLLPGQRDRDSSWYEAILHPLRLLAANLPWSALALGTLHPSFRRLWNPVERRLLQLLHCWTWPNLLFWSLVPNHATRHTLPLVPGLIGLGTFVVIAWFEGRCRWPFRAVSPRVALLALVLIWLGIKLFFVQVVIPERMRGRHPDSNGRLLAETIPPGETLYLFRVKDESLLFYYGRPVRRLAEPLLLPNKPELVYCIVTETEWSQWTGGDAAIVQRLSDSQGETVLLIRVGAM
jgi:4-amino-4-deoxy-L-arabinose transferase-like glycosyltransferase